jgi:hypothetical protein
MEKPADALGGWGNVPGEIWLSSTMFVPPSPPPLVGTAPKPSPRPPNRLLATVPLRDGANSATVTVPVDAESGEYRIFVQVKGSVKLAGGSGAFTIK